ncbi:hypothetical protein BH23BAC1_BH23BAC1_50440 [soil metagenome]
MTTSKLFFVIADISGYTIFTKSLNHNHVIFQVQYLLILNR